MNRSKNYVFVLLGLLVLANPQLAICSKNKDIERQLRSGLQDRMFLLRGLPTDNKLDFDSQLKLTSEIRPGPWYAAEMEVRKIQVKEKEIKISGDCLGYVDSGVKPAREIEVIITGPFMQDPTELLALIRDRVFVTKPDELSVLVPKPWQDLFLGVDPRKKGPGGIAGILPSGEVVYRVGAGVTAPKPIHTPDPEFSEEARKAKYHGKSVLEVIIAQDGRIHEINVSKPAGNGLDERAIKVARQWTFQPAVLNGKPVAVMVNIEFSFNLY